MKMSAWSSIDQFRLAARRGDAASKHARVRASFDTEVKADAGNSRSLVFTISTGAVDRMNDTISAAGWQIDNYLKNPVVLWAHDSSMLPIAKAKHVWVAGDKLKAIAEFTPAGMSRFNDTVFQMYKEGFLSATSVGFRPLKYSFSRDPSRTAGIDFEQTELLEFLAVPIPAAPEALIEARSAGLDVAPVLEWARGVLGVKRSPDDARARAAAARDRDLRIIRLRGLR